MIHKIERLAANKVLHGFRLKRSFEVTELRLLVAELEHEKSGAMHLHLDRDDPNKTFGVQFKTSPTNHSGISHILEHTVLCGSQNYPCRDPFMKMLRRSQATFMNALTASDWTLYPFSTMNNTDFHNLLKVYLDAVFRPKMEELDFMQEGWRLEPQNLDDPNSDLLLKGVVLNEMKGVFSNSLNRFAYAVQNNLLPQTYGFVSGGHPEFIPTLTLQCLKKFHEQCYHPSNSWFYTYGNVDLKQCLEFMDSEYLQHFEALTLDNLTPLENMWNEPRSIELSCEPDPMTPHPERQSCVSLSFRLDDIRNVYTNFVLGIVCSLLLDGDNAPLYRGLIESGYGLDWIDNINGIDRGTRTTSFHVGVQGVRADDVEKFPNLVMDIISEVVRDGFPKERVEATLHQYELAVRHESARFGLNLIMSLSNAVNHDVDVSEFLQIGSIVKRFRDEWVENPTMLQSITQQYFLDNKHRLTTIMRSDPSWKSVEAKKDEENLIKLTKDITLSDKETLTSKARQLLEKQNEEEDVSCLPCLDIFDIPLECRPESFTLTQTADCSVQLNEAPTNGLVYFHGLADLKDLPPNLLPYVPLFCGLFTRLGADGLSYLEMDQAIELHTAGLTASALATPKISYSEVNCIPTSRHIHLSGYCLESKLPDFFDLWSKLFCSPDWSDYDRLSTLIQMSAAGEWSANAISNSAHRFAMCRAAASLSSTLLTREFWSGMEQAKIMRHIAGKLDGKDEGENNFPLRISEIMKSIWQHIASRERLKFSLHGEPESLANGLKCLENFCSKLPKSLEKSNVSSDEDTVNDEDIFPSLSENIYFTMPYTVHYTAQAIKAPGYESVDYASYRVLSHLLSFKYLHREIREKGGAYGAGAVSKPEAFLFYSYRDPHAYKTLNCFESALHWAASQEFQQQDLKEAKLAVFQELDYPVSAGSRGLNYFLYGISDQLRQSHRREVFSVDAVKVKNIAEQIVHKLSDPSNSCTVGRVVLGPDSSPDWPSDNESQKLKTSWKFDTVAE
uniref:Presequence protease, mitochondrial n=1 Tax=Trichobilharzia regenti TaxID=157069 RepID=A0AA85JZE3_TRIRE|nr:unnamed protein product [Trichobilharzia regenti]